MQQIPVLDLTKKYHDKGATMIPKIIHYCWLSNEPYPEEIGKYINTWKNKLSDYQFVKWDFSKIKKEDFKWVSDAYDKKKYAFAADFIRCYALYNYGGIYLDSDVEVLKSFNDLLANPYFMCHEYKNSVIEAAIIGAKKNHPFFEYMLKYYENRNFIKEDGSCDQHPLPQIMEEIAKKHFNIKNISSPKEIDCLDDKNLCILPYDFFSPKSTISGKIEVSENTYAIHQFSNTWFPKYYRIEKKFWHLLGIKNLKICLRLVNLIKHGSIKARLFD